MKMKQCFLILTFYFLIFAARAQTQFFSTVKIEFEKTIAQHAMMKELSPEWFEMAKDHTPALLSPPTHQLPFRRQPPHHLDRHQQRSLQRKERPLQPRRHRRK